MQKIVIGSDRIGFQLKASLLEGLVDRGFVVEDVGPHEERSVHYPVIAKMVARMIAGGRGDRVGVLICSTGIGMSIAANRVKGARAANCSTVYLAERSRAHNDANILVLGSRILDTAQALRIVDAFMSTSFEGGKHAGRVRMLDDDEP